MKRLLSAAPLAALALATTTGSASAAAGGDLWIYGANGTRDTGIAMQAGTHPAITSMSASKDIAAVQTAGGVLETYDDATGATTLGTQGLDPVSSPGIGYGPGGLRVAFSAGTDVLYTGTGASGSSTGQTVRPGTSPSVAALAGGGFEYAFNNGNANMGTGDGSSWVGELGLDAASSPAIAALNGGGWQAVFSANTDVLWKYVQHSGASTGLGMYPQTSPAISGVPSQSGKYEAAFEANTGALYLWGNLISTNSGVGMAAGTSPAITVLSDNTIVLAYQLPNGDLGVYPVGSPAIDTGLKMAPGTSPAISSAATSYEVAFQGAPAPAPAPVTTTPTTGSPSTTTPATPAPTTTTTETTPTPGSSPQGARPALKFRFSFSWSWTRHSSRLRRLALIRYTTTHKRVRVKVRVKGKLVTKVKTETVRHKVKIPKGTSIAIACHGRGCPRLPKPRRGATLSQRLAALDGKVFAPGDLLTITARAPGYSTEKISARILAGRIPRLRAGG